MVFFFDFDSILTLFNDPFFCGPGVMDCGVMEMRFEDIFLPLYISLGLLTTFLFLILLVGLVVVFVDDVMRQAVTTAAAV